MQRRKNWEKTILLTRRRLVRRIVICAHIVSEKVHSCLEMPSPNPYSISHECGEFHPPTDRAAWTWCGAMVGGILGATSACGLGVFGIWQQSSYAVALDPGQVKCGMGMLAAIVTTIFGTPLCGLAGMLSGSLLGLAASYVRTTCLGNSLRNLHQKVNDE